MNYKIVLLVILTILLLFVIFIKITTFYEYIPVIFVITISTLSIPYLGIDLLNNWIKSPYYAYFALLSGLIIFYIIIYPISDSLHVTKLFYTGGRGLLDVP